ncbi:MAG: hypothetical protein ACLPX5_09290 [Dissulfurispiraceae bacterium]
MVWAEQVVVGLAQAVALGMEPVVPTAPVASPGPEPEAEAPAVLPAMAAPEETPVPAALPAMAALEETPVPAALPALEALVLSHRSVLLPVHFAAAPVAGRPQVILGEAISSQL